MEIILKFNTENVFSPNAIKYGIDEADIIKNVRWLVNCAFAGIHGQCGHYEPWAIRYVEMQILHKNLMNQIRAQLTPEQIENILET